MHKHENDTQIPENFKTGNITIKFKKIGLLKFIIFKQSSTLSI